MEKPATSRELVAWAESLAAIARTGLGFTENLYERERYEEVLHVAASIRAASASDVDPADLAQEWVRSVGSGVAGYVTPKISVGAVVANDDRQILLVQRADFGIWLYPTGWADVGYSAAEVAQKEVWEETGIQSEPVAVLGVLDGLRLGFSQIPLYSIVFHCRAVGGELRGHPLETSAVGWFDQDDLPSPVASADRWVEHAFAAIRGESSTPDFDPPRDVPWA